MSDSTTESILAGNAMMSIGALARATGIPAETLRTWERRYGFPVPLRRASGHRRYPMAAVPHLRLIKQALDRGNRPSSVVGASEASLRQLIGLDAANRDEAPRGTCDPRLSETLARWIDAAKKLDDRLDAELRREWSTLGARDFLLERAVPFLREVGEGWADGTLGVMHEHFAATRMRDFLAEQWRALNTGNRGTPVICAALSREQHDLPLHIAALFLSLCGLPVIFLGADTPADEVAAAAMQSNALAIVIASSPSAGAQDVEAQLAAVRRQVPLGVSIVVGGTAARNLDGADRMRSFKEFDRWARALGAAGLPA